MHKIYSLICVACFVIGGSLLVGNAHADNDGGLLSGNNTVIGKGNNGIQGDKNHHNIIIDDVTLNSGTNAGGGDIINRNTNTNRNNNTNTNVNVNTQGQMQGQMQGQLQGQGQGQKQSIHIENPVTYDHIGSGVAKTDAENTNHDAVSYIRMYSSIFKYDNDEFITMTEAKSASKGADVDVSKAILREANVQLNNLNWKDDPTGVYMGSLTLTTEDATLDQVVARACVEAMKLGATGANFYSEEAKRLSATKYGIDFGSAASVAVNGSGSAVIAPGSTLGWSKTKTNNMIVGEVYVELFHDVTLIVE
jgi:hypothetical protein